MALLLLFNCNCGELYGFCITQKQLYGEIMGMSGNWAIDGIEEVSAYRMEIIRHTVEKGFKGIFIDTSKIKSLTCKCDKIINIFDMISDMIKEALQAEVDSDIEQKTY